MSHDPQGEDARTIGVAAAPTDDGVPVSPAPRVIPAPPVPRPGGLLARLRIRKKLIVLHTAFSLALAVILLVALRPAIARVVTRAEASQARAILRLATASAGGADAAPWGEEPGVVPGAGEGVSLRAGSAEALAIPGTVAQRAMLSPGVPIDLPAIDTGARAVVYVPGAGGGRGGFILATVRAPDARAAVGTLYAIMIGALLAVYALVALALEAFVLPRHVYGPIRRLLRADRAVQEGRRLEELIPESAIPADELGEIMRSRNRSIASLRRHERALADALAQLHEVATDLRRKNHLLEAAQRNLADADRLASLGMLSAGLAHELNTPLTVLKGLVEKLQPGGRAAVAPDEAALMLRVVRRLERLGESLLDLARVRPPACIPTDLGGLVDEAVTLVRLDRDARLVRIDARIPPGFVVPCDPGRMLQVLVNLIRNALDASRENAAPARTAAVEARANEACHVGSVEIDARAFDRDGGRWASIVIRDDGPGFRPEVLSRLFEPFFSTRLDSRGTGLGLAVSQGIAREHGGLILARNRADRRGAELEILLPIHELPTYTGSRPGGGQHEPAPV